MTEINTSADIAHAMATAAVAHSAMNDIRTAKDALKAAVDAADERRAQQVMSAQDIFYIAVRGALSRYENAMASLEVSLTPDNDDDE